MKSHRAKARVGFLGPLVLAGLLTGPAAAQETEADSGTAAGEIRWAPGMEGTLILGLDGGLYEPYAAAVVQRVQEALTSAGHYTGPASGILDGPTMEALAAYQRANGLSPSGVPTPATRDRLLSDRRDARMRYRAAPRVGYP